MEISVTGRHVEISESMKAYVVEKVGRLQRLYDRIERIAAVIDRESTRIRTELVLHTADKHTLIAQTQADEFNESVDLVIDKMERQLHEHKEMLRNHKHRPGGGPKPGM